MTGSVIPLTSTLSLGTVAPSSLTHPCVVRAPARDGVRAETEAASARRRSRAARDRRLERARATYDIGAAVATSFGDGVVEAH